MFSMGKRGSVIGKGWIEGGSESSGILGRWRGKKGKPLW